VSPLEKTAGKRKPTAMDGLIDRVTGLRVLKIIVEITWPVETQFTNIKPASIKKDLARTLQIALISYY
jgi:hypothetical protein